MPEEILREENREAEEPGLREVPLREAEARPEAPAPAELAPSGERQTEQRDLELLMQRIQGASGQPAAQSSLQADALALSEADETERVQKLVSLAEAKGVEHAVRVARSLNDFYALDLLHDELVERLHALLDQEAAQGR